MVQIILEVTPSLHKSNPDVFPTLTLMNIRSETAARNNPQSRHQLWFAANDERIRKYSMIVIYIKLLQTEALFCVKTTREV